MGRSQTTGLKPSTQPAAPGARENRENVPDTVSFPYAGQGPDLGEWLEDAQINTDRNLRLQYLAGMGLNAYQGAAIYNDLVSCRKFPEDLFLASPERKLQLRAAIDKPASAK